MTLRIRKIFLVFFGALFSIDVLVLVYLNVSYKATLPRVPSVSVGRTIPHNVHGTVVYLTEEESKRLEYLRWLGFGSFAIIGAIGVCCPVRPPAERK